MPRIAMGFEAAEGDRLSEKGMARLIPDPKGLERCSSRPVDMDGRGLVLKPLAPYREGAWMGMAAMTTGLLERRCTSRQGDR